MELGEIIERAIATAVERKVAAVLAGLSIQLDTPLVDLKSAQEAQALRAFANLSKGSQLTQAQYDALPPDVKNRVPRSKRPGYLRPGTNALTAITAEEFSQVLDANAAAYRNAFHRNRNATMLKLCYFCGLRRASVARVRVQDVLFERAVLLLPAPMQKNRRAHEVTLTHGVLADLREMCAGKAAGDFLFTPDEQCHAANRFRWDCAEPGHISDGGCNAMIQKIKSTLRREPFNWSAERLRFFGWPSLRKSAAVAVERRLGINAARELLNHRSTNTTLRYLASRNEDIRTVQDEMEFFLKSAQKGLTRVDGCGNYGT